MHELKEAFIEAIVSGLKSKTLTSCSRWATKCRVMGENSDFPGSYSFKYHPWCKEISDTTASMNATMKSAQMGVTEVAINRAFYAIDILKKDVLYVLPTSKNASDFSKARFSSALLHSEYLKNLFTDTNSVELKQAGGINLYIRGSRGNSNLKSVPVSTLILDEVDEMDASQIELAFERLSGHLEKSIWAISTPSIPKKGIHNLYLAGSQEHWMFKCSCCNKITELIWPDSFELCGETIDDPNCINSYIKCKECNKKIEHEEKYSIINKGFWQPTVNNYDKDSRSFYINQLYSSTVTPKEIAYKYFRGLSDESAATEFYNSKLGLPYLGETAQLTDEIIDQSIRNHTKQDKRPERGGVKLITMGVDTGKWNYVVVLEWFIKEPGKDLNAIAEAKLLWEGKLLGSEFTRLDHLMFEWQVLGCVIDFQPETNEARRFAKRFEKFITLCQYRKGKSGKEITIQEDEGAPIATVDRTNWMDAALGRYYSKRIILPRDVSLEFRTHLKNEVRTYVKDDLGNYKAVYVETGPDHFAHAQTYAEIALPLAISMNQNRPIEAFL